MDVGTKKIGIAVGVIILVALVAYPMRHYKKKLADDAYWAEQAKADEAKFKSLCRDKAVYKIYKVVKNVDAIQLLKIRQKGNWADQLEPSAALAHEYTGDSYIGGFLLQEMPLMSEDATVRPARRKIDPLSPRDRGQIGALPDQKQKAGEPPYSPGYKYVDIYENGARYRVTGSKKVIGRANSSAYGIQLELKKDPNFDLNIYRWSLDRVVDNDPPPRYAVTFEDYVIPEERARGFASSRIVVLDTQTNEVLGEVMVYAWGWKKASGGNPTPWLTASSCPGLTYDSGHTTRGFVDQVLIPTGSVYERTE